MISVGSLVIVVHLMVWLLWSVYWTLSLKDRDNVAPMVVAGVVWPLLVAVFVVVGPFYMLRDMAKRDWQ